MPQTSPRRSTGRTFVFEAEAREGIPRLDRLGELVQRDVEEHQRVGLAAGLPLDPGARRLVPCDLRRFEAGIAAVVGVVVVGVHDIEERLDPLRVVEGADRDDEVALTLLLGIERGVDAERQRADDLVDPAPRDALGVVVAQRDGIGHVLRGEEVAQTAPQHLVAGGVDQIARDDDQVGLLVLDQLAEHREEVVRAEVGGHVQVGELHDAEGAVHVEPELRGGLPDGRAGMCRARLSRILGRGGKRGEQCRTECCGAEKTAALHLSSFYRAYADHSASHQRLTSSIEGAFRPSLFFLLKPQRSLKNFPGASFLSEPTVM